MVVSEIRSHTTTKTVFIACGAVGTDDEEQFGTEVKRIIQELPARNYHVTAWVEDTGSLTAWLSSKRVYYYLTPVRRESAVLAAQLPEKGFGHYVAELYGLFSRTHSSAAVIAGYSPCTAAFLLAAGLAGVPIFILTASAESSYLAQDSRTKAKLLHVLKDLGVCADADTIWRQINEGSKPSAKSLLTTVSATVKLSWHYSECGRNTYLYIKRWFDVVSALTLLLTTGLITWCLITFKSHRIVKSTVLGKNNKTFTLYTLQSVRTPALQSRLWWLLAMLNVLRGDISFVGPRIIAAEEHSRQGNQALFYSVAPGLVAWSQLRAAKDDGEEHLALMDSLYMATINPVLDIKIVMLGLLCMLKLQPVRTCNK